MKKQRTDRLPYIDTSQPQDYKQAVKDEIRRLKRAHSKAAQSKKFLASEQFDLEGSLEHRRTEAIINSLDEIIRLHPDLVDEWIAINLNCSTYTITEAQCHILLGAAIWILDRFAETDTPREELYKVLPTDMAEMDDLYFVDLWDSSFDMDLITAVECVLHFRNADIKPIEQTTDGNFRVVTDKLTADGKHKAESPRRRRFEQLIALIPQEEIEEAVEHFKQHFEAWRERFFACVKPMTAKQKALDDKLNRIRKQINDNRDAAEKLAHEMQAERKKPKQKPSPLLAPLAKPDTSFSVQSVAPSVFKSPPPMIGDLGTIMHKLDELDDQHNDLIDEINDVIHQKGHFMFHVNQRGLLSKAYCEKEYGADVAAGMEPIPIPNPYELCFALLYLIEQNSDLPWLYGVGVGMMNEVGEALPWGIIEFDEDDVEDEYPDNPSNIPDWYERKYYRRGEEDDFDFPRSLAQIIYEETGCLMPRDMHECDNHLRELGRYGIRRNQANPYLYCMLALTNAKWTWKAQNFNELYMAHVLGEKSETEDAEPEMSREEMSDKLSAQEHEIQRLRAALHTAEKTAADAQKKLDAVKSASEAEHRELADLREIMFRADAAESDEDAADESIFPYEVQHDTILFGGHATFLKTIRQLLTGNIRYVDREQNFDLTMIRYAEVLWIQPNALAHKQFYKIADTARKYGKPIRYLQYASAAKCAEQIAENDA